MSRPKSSKGSRPPARSNRYRSRRARPLTQSVRDFLGALWRAGKLVCAGVFVVVVVGGISAGLVVGYHYLLHSPYFMVRKVVLTGLDRVSREEVLARTGLDQPTNILAVRLGTLAANLERLPWVKSVSVTRKLPDTLVLRITERQPRVLIRLGALYYLDETGRPFKKVGAGEDPRLPVLTGFTRKDLTERERFFRQDLAQVFALMDVLAERSDRFRLDNIAQISFDPVRGMNLLTRDQDVRVKVGFGEYRAKLRRLGRVVAYMKITGQQQGLSYVNLECSPRVIVRRGRES